MNNSNPCPCPNLTCPNHANCADCASRHLRMGKPNYCGYVSILPLLMDVIENAEDQNSVQKIKDMIESRENTYTIMRNKNKISDEKQKELEKEKSELSEY